MKRTLLSEKERRKWLPTKLVEPQFGGPVREGEIGRLFTTSQTGKKQVFIIGELGTVSIGRGLYTSDCLIELPDVSLDHCRVFSHLSDQDEMMVVLEDTSSNGTMWRGRVIRKRSVILSHKDQFEVGGQLFLYLETFPSSLNGISENGSMAIDQYFVYPRILGTGAYSTVRLAYDTFKLRQVACKTIYGAAKTSRREGAGLDVLREVQTLKALDHPNISKVRYVSSDDKDFHIFLDLHSGGDLFGYLQRSDGMLPSYEAKFILYQVLKALVYLHDKAGVSHRDIKLENVLLEGQGPMPRIYLADFGHSKIMERADACMSLKGTFYYMAPEVLDGIQRKQGYDGKLADCWSTGVLLYYLLAGKHPFERNEPLDDPVRGLSDHIGNSFDGNLGDLDKRSVRQERLTLKHIVCAEGFDVRCLPGHSANLIKKLLRHDPARRLTSAQAMAHAWIEESRSQLDNIYAKVVG